MKRLIVRTSLTMLLLGMVVGILQCECSNPWEDMFGSDKEFEGGSCTTDSDCWDAYHCWNEICTLTMVELGFTCYLDEQCRQGDCIGHPVDLTEYILDVATAIFTGNVDSGICSDGNEGSPCYAHFQCNGTLRCSKVGEYSTGYCTDGLGSEDVVSDIGEIACTPDCVDNDCGEDGCGGSCGQCDEESNCIDGRCVYINWKDPATGLEWQNPAAEIQLKWEAAKQYCESNQAELPGTGWRLPAISELRTLIQGCPATESGGGCKIDDEDCVAAECWDASCKGCEYIDSPDDCYWRDEMEGPCWWYWSASPVEGSDSHSWYVGFTLGSVTTAPVDNKGNVRCVR